MIFSGIFAGPGLFPRPKLHLKLLFFGGDCWCPSFHLSGDLKELGSSEFSFAAAFAIATNLVPSTVGVIMEGGNVCFLRPLETGGAPLAYEGVEHMVSARKV